MADLAAALDKSRSMLREALTKARTELQELEDREAELKRQIAEAELALGETHEAPAGGAQLTLHEALVHVLRESGSQGLTARELADAVNRRRLYRKRDGSPVEVNQIQARVNNYGSLFTKDGTAIRLREESEVLAMAPPEITVFRDDDDGFFEWLAANADGYFINTSRNPKASYLVLHKPSCPHFTGGGSLHWTKEYVKACSTDRTALEDWALNDVGGEVTLCRSCFG
jgi:hypothetical protein